jgi:Flp pilus assembly protein TadG
MSIFRKRAPVNPEGIDLRSIRERARAILRGDDRGSSLVEFALTLPPLMLLSSGMCVMGIAMNNYLILTNATGVAARQISVSRGQTLDPCATAVATLTTAAPTLTASKLTYSYVFNGVAYSGTSCSSTAYTSGAPSYLVQGQPAQMVVNYPCSLGAYNVNFAPGCNLRAQLTEVVQ